VQVEDVDERLCGQFVIAQGGDDGKKAAVAADGLLPVVEPHLPLLGAVVVGHIAGKKHKMGPQFADQLIGRTPRLAVIARIPAGNDRQAGVGPVGHGQEGKASADPFAVLNDKIIYRIRSETGKPDEMIVHALGAVHPVGLPAGGIKGGVPAVVFGVKKQDGIAARKLIPADNHAGGRIVSPHYPVAAVGGVSALSQ